MKFITLIILLVPLLTGCKKDKVDIIKRNLDKAAKIINDNAPIITEGISIDKATSGPGYALNYFYTVLEVNASSIDKVQFKKEKYEYTLQHYKTDHNMSVMWKNNVKLTYSYSDELDNKICEFTLLPSEHY